MAWRDDVARALAELSGELREFAAALIAVPSVGGTPAEGQVQHLVADWLGEHGLDVERSDVAIDPDAAGFPGMEVPRSVVTRVVGRLPGSGSGPDLLLLGHTDVVPAADAALFQPRWDQGRLLGRGASDMKSGVAAMCWAAAALARCGITLGGDVVVAPVSAEEDGGAGTFALLRHPGLRLRPGSAAIIPEPTSNSMVTANAGCLTFKLTLRGRSAHGALRWRGVNPIDALPVVLDALHRLEAQRCAGAGPLFADWPLAYPISIGTIEGGDWASTVPSQISITGRYGVRLDETLPQARAAFESAIAAACAEDPWLAEHPPQITWWGAQFASAATGEDEPVVAALRRAGAGGEPSAAPYGSDLRLLVGSGLPTVQFGPGDPDLAHSDAESVAWSDVTACAHTLALTAGHFCGTGPRLWTTPRAPRRSSAQ